MAQKAAQLGELRARDAEGREHVLTMAKDLTLRRRASAEASAEVETLSRRVAGLEELQEMRAALKLRTMAIHRFKHNAERKAEDLAHAQREHRQQLHARDERRALRHRECNGG